MNIQKLKSVLEARLEEKKNFINEITNFVCRYDGKIVFDDIQSEEPNVILPIDYLMSEPIMVGVDSITYDKNTCEVLLDCGWYEGEDACEMDIPLDELSIDALYELVYWLDLYDKEQNDKFVAEQQKRFAELKKEAARKNTPFSAYFCTQLDFNDFIHLLPLIAAETKQQEQTARKIATPRAIFAYTLFSMEN
ncbi:MAG: hypothetical protein J6X18_00580 [Bacteroidales bacterium]|nr:hypothetical protein [Bacteroidales bacterium]